MKVLIINNKIDQIPDLNRKEILKIIQNQLTVIIEHLMGVIVSMLNKC